MSVLNLFQYHDYLPFEFTHGPAKYIGGLGSRGTEVREYCEKGPTSWIRKGQKPTLTVPPHGKS